MRSDDPSPRRRAAAPIAGVAALVLGAAALLVVAMSPEPSAPAAAAAAPGASAAAGELAMGPSVGRPGAAPAAGASGPGAPLGPPSATPPPPASAARRDAARSFEPVAPELKQRGVALGLFAEDVSFDYRPLLAEIAALGANHVALVVPLYQEHAASTSLALHTRFSPTLEALLETTRAARGAGLAVTIFPIVRLSAPRAPEEWRGTLRPADPDAWFDSYGSHLGDLAAVATSAGATRLVIGSELSTLDGDLPRWTALIEKIRGLFKGPLLYSANWDHYAEAKLLDLVDEAGVTAYFGLRAKEEPADLAALEARWRALRGEIEGWLRARRPQPFVFTEVGYRSRAGATVAPWDESSGGVVDLEEQRRAFEAFRRAWAGAASLAGVYVWNWYGFGGAGSRGYTPRGKPAAAEVKRLLQEL